VHQLSMYTLAECANSYMWKERLMTWIGGGAHTARRTDTRARM
jgi:hypothetical protein